jgi:pimeloyl-ACP methyl ester carboxylesterase
LPGPPTPLVLLPGLLCDRRLFGPQLPALEAGGRRVLVPDLTGEGTVEALAARVLAEAPPGPFALCGLSMGGYVAQEIVRQAPERVARLALLDTRARADSPEETARRRGLIELAERGEFRGVTPRLLPLLVHRDRLADGALTGLVQAMAAAVGRDAFLRQQRAIMARRDYRPLLAAIRVPTLVLCGREDAITPPEMHHEMAAAVPDATLVVLPNCGHLAPLERPGAVAAQLAAWLGA